MKKEEGKAEVKKLFLVASTSNSTLRSKLEFRELGRCSCGARGTSETRRGSHLCVTRPSQEFWVANENGISRGRVR
jgi:hypothetical protein